MKVRVTVLSQRGKCSQGHRVGDSWVIGDKTEGGICFSAFCSLLPWVQMLRFDGKTAWEVEVPCPDWVNPVVFRLEKVKE
ncbi:MAG: TIGR04076 family protein [Bacillota bacterium]